MRKHGGQKGLVQEKYVRMAGKSKPFGVGEVNTKESRFPMVCKIYLGLVLINNHETQIKLMVILPLMVPECLQSMVIQLKLGAPMLLGGQEIQLGSV